MIEPLLKLFASHNNLNNLVAIVDRNYQFTLDFTEDLVELEPVEDKWKSFGWEVRQVDGHDTPALLDIFQAVPFATGKPSLVIAHTIKGKGISFMENVPIWHYRLPNADEMKIACAQLGIDELILQTQ